ncbi:MAG: hypothetical protein RBQ91_02260 [Acholeplasma sp.]|nr:hypothetical protein [Acholeplasma sp.]
MTNLKRLFESFDKSGVVFLNNHIEVIFQVKYQELEFNFSKITYDQSLEYEYPENAPKKYTRFETRTHEAFFRYEEDNLNCKVLEWLSRPAFKEGNEKVHEWYLNGINKYLGTNFTNQDIEEIYCHLGNQINRPLTLKFIESNYNIEVLKK